MIDFIGFSVGAARAIRRQDVLHERRSSIATAARGLIDNASRTASVVLLRPMVVMAARVMGPGPARLRMVKLAHSLNARRLTVVPVEEGGERFEGPSVQPTTRAA